ERGPGTAPAVADGDRGVGLAAGLLEGDRLVRHLPGLDGQRRGGQVATCGQLLAEEPADPVLAGGTVVMHGNSSEGGGTMSGLGPQRPMTGLALWSTACRSEVSPLPAARGRTAPARAAAIKRVKISPRGERTERLLPSGSSPSICSGSTAADGSGAGSVPFPADRSRAICEIASPIGLTAPCSSNRPRVYSTS